MLRPKALLQLLAFFLGCVNGSYGQSSVTKGFAPLSDTNRLLLVNVNAETVEYQGRKAIRLTRTSAQDGFAIVRDVAFQDGTIDADIAVKIKTPPGVRMPGFVGIAFRARRDASHYELFYIRPGNADADDQAMRNHSVQYVSAPNFDWYKLRREWPWVYEAYADVNTEKWMHIKIEVKGRSARLYLGGSGKPSLVVDGLKSDDLQGGVALWPYPGEEAYFSNVRITSAAPLPLKNGSEPDGKWEVKISSDTGQFLGSMQLRRTVDRVSGTWSGKLGDARPIDGSWHQGYVELRFNAEWPQGGVGDPGIAPATLAGWLDGDHASGRMKVESRTDGTWTATRISAPDTP